MSAVIAVAAIGFGGLGVGFMMVMPALVVLLPLLCGRYLGEGAIERARRALRSVRIREAGVSITAEVALGRYRVARGGRLIAASLAKRPPPLGAVK